MLRLRELRRERKLSQIELASILGVTQAALSGWETGKYSIDSQTLVKIADYFDCSTDYLLGRVAYPELEKRKAPPESGAVSYDAAKGSSDLSAEEIQKLRKLLDNLPD